MTTPAPVDNRSFKVQGRDFKLNKIDAFQQFHIVRRIGPLLAEFLPVLGQIQKKVKDKKFDTLTEDEKFQDFAQVAQPLMSGLAKLSDADADYVLLRLLSSVEVHQSQFSTWTRVATPAGIQMQDIELPVLMQAAGRALMFNLSGFLAITPPK